MKRPMGFVKGERADAVTFVRESIRVNVKEYHFSTNLNTKRIPITPEQFTEFCDQHRKHKWRWPAVFSCNAKGEVWVPTSYGRTPENEKINLRDRLPLLGWVADVYWPQRDLCGRFFVDERGAFMKPGAELIQFVQWDSGDEKLERPPNPFMLTGEAAIRLLEELL